MSTVKKRPQLNPEDLGRLRWGLGAVLALLSVLTVFFMDIDAWLLMPVVASAALAALIWPTWPARVPGFVHRLAFPFIVLAFAYDITSSGEPLPSLIRLDLLLILYRLVTYRQRRDDLQLVILGLFLIIVAGVITVSLSFAVQLLAFTSCALIMLLAVTLEHADGTAPKPLLPGVVPSWARGSWSTHFSRLRAATDWRLAVLGATGFGAMVVLSGLLFLAIPRFDIESSLFIDRLINRTTRSGFSENIKFGEITSIISDDSLAVSIDVTDPAAMPRNPYWRMVVLDEYTGEGFKISQRFRRQIDSFRTPRGRINGTESFRRGEPTWTFFVEPGISRYLPLLGNFYEMSFTEPQTFAISDQLRVVALQRDPPKMFAYRTWIMDTTGSMKDATFALARQRGEASGQVFTDLPAGIADQPRLQTLLTETGARTAANTTAFSTIVVDWLGDIHPYSLESAVPPGEGDALIRWLDSETPGHCEFFAGSFVVLARAAGYPARLVSGFRGGSWNDFSGSFAVRNSNAHAWCEIFDDATASWIRVDPTPGNQTLANSADNRSSESALDRQRDNSWQARLDSLRVFWYRRIVNFDINTQEQMISSTKEFFRKASQRVIKWADIRASALRSWVQQPWNVARFSDMIIGVLSLGVLVWLWRKHSRPWWFKLRRSTGLQNHDPIRREAGRWLQKGEKRADFSWPSEVRLALLRLRFGSPQSWSDPLSVFRTAKIAFKNSQT
jgi:transglutaminase-like putative cysteine protease